MRAGDVARRTAAVPGSRRRDDGSAIVEFCFLAVVLMVPLVYVVLAVFAVQGAAYAVAAATREAGRAFTTTPEGADPRARAYEAARVAMDDHGIALSPAQLELSCTAQPCLTAGETVSAEIVHQVPLPFLPTLFDGAVPATVRVDATHVAYVDRYRSVS